MGDRRCVYRILERRPEEKRPLDGHRHRLEDNIEMDLQGAGWVFFFFFCDLLLGMLHCTQQYYMPY